MAPITAKTDSEAVLKALESLFDAVEGLEAADTRSEDILNPLHTILSRLSLQQDASAEVQYEQLNALFGIWSGNVALESAPSVNLEIGSALPAGYPVEVVPLPKNAMLIISEGFPDDNGQPGDFNLTLKCAAAPSEVSAYYTTVFGSVSNLETSSISGMTVFSGQRQGYDFSVLITTNTLGGSEKSMVQISVMME